MCCTYSNATHVAVGAQCQPLCSETLCSSATCSAQLSLLALATRKNWQINHLCGVVTVSVNACCRLHRMELEVRTAHSVRTSYTLKSTVLSYCLYYWVKRITAKARVSLTFICPCIANILSEYNQQFIYFCKTLYMFQAGFPSIIRSSKLHIQRQAFVRPLLLPAASLANQANGSIGLTNA